MPQREIDLAVAYYARGRKLISYDGTYAYWDKSPLIESASSSAFPRQPQSSG